MVAKPLLVFDVNETLLDLDHLRPLFGRWFGDEEVMRDWFAQLILYSQSLSLSGLQSDFGTLAGSVLRMLGTIREVEIGEEDRQLLRKALGEMPAHEGAVEALSRLRDQGFRMVTLTNSPPLDGPSAVEKAGLEGFFEQSFSVQPTRRFKPAPETYQLVSDALAVPVTDLCLVACHVWDTIGLQAMGGKGALVTHGVNAALDAPGVPQPDLVAPDLSALADLIAAKWAA